MFVFFPSLSCDSKVKHVFLLPAVDRLSSLKDSTGVNPAGSDWATSEKRQEINDNLWNSNNATKTDPDFQIPITNIDDILSGGSRCVEENTHTLTHNNAASHVPISSCPSQQNLSATPSLQVPIKSSALDFSNMDPAHANQQNEVCHGSNTKCSDSDDKMMYPVGEDSDSTTDSSVMVTTTADSSGLHDLFSDEEEVELFSCDSQQPGTDEHNHLNQTSNKPVYFKHVSSQKANLDETVSAVSPIEKENSHEPAHCPQHSPLLGVFSTSKPSHSSNGTNPVSSPGHHLNSAVDTSDKACKIFTPGSLQTDSSPSPPNTFSDAQGCAAILHADDLLTSDLSNNLQTKTPQSLPVLSNITCSDLNTSTSDTRLSPSTVNKENVLGCISHLSSANSLLEKNSGLNSSDCLVWRNGFTFQSKKSTSAPILKGLSVKSKNKPQNECLQSTSESGCPLTSNTGASLSQSTKLSPTANRYLKTNAQSDMYRCFNLPKEGDVTQSKAEHRPSVDTLQTVQLISEKDVWSGTTQRTVLQVQLSRLSDSSSLTTHNEPDKWRFFKPTATQLVPTISPSTAEKPNVVVSKSLLSSLCSTKETHLTTSSGMKPSTSVETGDVLRSSMSRLYLKRMDRRSLSTDTVLSANCNQFSVQHKIKSFENLANFDKPVIKNHDILSYSLTHIPSLNQRIAGYMGLVNSTDYRAQQRGSYVPNQISTTPCSPYLGSIGTINLELPHSSCKTVSLTEDSAENDIQKVPHGTTPLTSQLLLKKHRKISSRFRQLRALSMPELEKLCKEDYSEEHGGFIDTTAVSIHPIIIQRAEDTASLSPSATAAQGTTKTQGHQPSWSIR